jgi:predicted ATP-grasp superfamily ATP-dependent carboligase
LKKILITDASYKHTLGITRSLGKHGYKIDLIGSENSVSKYSKYCNKVVYDENRFREEFIDEFIDLLKKENYYFLIAISAFAVELISKHSERIKKLVDIHVPDIKNVELCLSKEKTYNHLKKIKINQPVTWDFYNYKEFLKALPKIKFPSIVKSKSEINKIDTEYYNSPKELSRKVSEFFYENNSIPIIQERVIGDGYGFFAIYLNGKCKSYFMHKRIREFPVMGGSSTCAKSIYDEDLKNEGLKILNHLNWNGVAMVEFKKCQKTGKFYLIEINPKYWGSHDLAIECGMNFPLLSIQLIKNIKNNSQLVNYKTEQKYHWPFEGELMHLLKKPSSILNICFDLFNFKVKSNIKILDLRPNIFSFFSNHKIKIIIYTLFKDLNFLKFYFRIKSIGFKLAFVRFLTETTGIQILKYSKVNKNIFIGCQHSNLGKIFLRFKGINSSICLRDEFDDRDKKLNFVNHKHLPIVEYQSPTINQLINVTSYINDEISKNNKVFIHCSEGISRASTIVIAYLMTQGYSLNDATEHLKKIRPFINVLPSQKEILYQFSNTNYVLRS